jgi:hypothetical protein
MTGAELESIRRKLGMTAAALGRRLLLPGRDPGRYVREWETGALAVPGPVQVAATLLLERAAAPQASPPEALAPPALALEPAPKLKPVAPWKSPSRNRRRR